MKGVHITVKSVKNYINLSIVKIKEFMLQKKCDIKKPGVDYFFFIITYFDFINIFVVLWIH